MAKIGRDAGPTIDGASTAAAGPLYRGQRLTIVDGAITFEPDLRLERDTNGRLKGVVDNLPGSGVPGLTEAERLISARTAMASGLLTWLAMGDSITQGFYATTSDLRYTKLAATALQTAAGDSAAAGYRPKHSSLSYAATWTTSGTVTEFETSGLGYGAVGPAANGGYIEITETCDRFWVLYTGGALIGKFGVQVDGGASVNVPSLAPAAVTGGNFWDSGALSDASHAVRITATDALFPPRIEGILFFRGNGNTSGSQGALSAANARTGSGVRCINAGRFGSKAATFAVSGATTWWTDALPTLAPRLVTMAFGANEHTAGDSPTTFRRNLLTVMDRIAYVCTNASLPVPSFLLEIPHGMGTTSTSFDAYAEAIRAAADDRGAAVFDFREITGWVGTSTADTYGITSTSDPDNARVHLSDLGHRLLGQLLADYILRAIGGTRV
jgi:lysophospholipase L1-like esterase